MTGIENFAGDRGPGVTGYLLTLVKFHFYCEKQLLCIKNIEVQMYELHLYQMPSFGITSC